MQKNFRIFWEVVPGEMCQLKCLSCYAAEGGRPDRRVLGEEEAKIAVNHIVSLRCDQIDTLGGEPLMYEKLPFIIQHFKKKKPKGFFGVVTNGLLLDYKKACELKDVGLDKITFSFDGVTDEVNDANRGKGSFKKALNGVENAQKVGLSFGISFTINKFNLNQTSHFIIFAENIGAKSVGVQIIDRIGRADKFWNKIGIKHEEALSTICRMFEKRPNIFIAISSRIKFKRFLNKFWNTNLELKDERCAGGILSLMVSSGGDIFPCSIYAYQQNKKSKSLIYNNFKEIKNFVDVEYLKFNKNVRKQAAQNFITCHKCKFSGVLCNPCPLINNPGTVEECEWVERQEIFIQNRILKSKLKCLIQPKIVQDKLIFCVKTQKEPLILKISQSEFAKFFLAKNVEEIINWFNEDNATEKVIKFVCQLRSYGIIEIENFKFPFIKLD